MKQIIDLIDERFSEALKAKTNWSAADVQILYTRIKNEVFLEYLNKTIGK